MGDGVEESIEFTARYGSWVAVKRIMIDQGTKPEEIVLQLAGIRQSIDRKAFEILGINTQELDAYAAKMVEGKRKTYASLGEVMQNLGKGEAKEIATKAAVKPELEGLAMVYLFRKVVQSLALDFDINQDNLQKAFPGLKIPKPMGRRPKQ